MKSATVVDEIGGKRWYCECDCGQAFIADHEGLVKGWPNSCRACRPTGNRKHGYAKVGQHIKLYGVWAAMRGRCNTPSNPHYKNYGGRGIKVCPEWDDFAVFMRDVGVSWVDGLTLDRIDNFGPYAAWNCRWATRREQQNNMRTNRIVETPMGPLTLANAARWSGIRYDDLRYRLRRNWPQAKLFA